MEDLHLRDATLNDLKVLRGFEQGVIEAERPMNKNIKEGDIIYYDLEKLISSADAKMVIAEIDHEIVGTGYALIQTAKPYFKEERYTYLGFMYTKPSWRGKGINRKIILELEEWTLENGIFQMKLEVYTENKMAIKAYKKTGFTNEMILMKRDLKR